jgi:hypothetical protein
MWKLTTGTGRVANAIAIHAGSGLPRCILRRLFVLVAEMCELSPHDVVGSLCVKGRVAKKSLSHEDDQDDQTALRFEYLSAQ